jgi:hypothetical protein
MTAPDPRYLDAGNDEFAVGVQQSSRQRFDLADLTSYVERASRHLPESQRGELVAALRRVWLRNRLPERVPSAAVRDVADHCDAATIAALAALGVRPGPLVDPQPPAVWPDHPRRFEPGRPGPGREW